MKICIIIIVYLIKIGRILAQNDSVVNRDGPVGLDGHVRLRNSDVYIKRRKHKMINTRSPEIEQFNKELSKSLGESKNNLKQINELVTNNQEYSILDPNAMNYNYDFNFIPEWFNALPPSFSSPKEFVLDSLSSLAHMGLVSLLSTDVFNNAYCSVFSSEQEKLVCLKNSVERINKIAETGKLIMSLNFRVLAGGRTAKEALVSLNTLASNPDNVGLIKTLGSTIVMYITMMREVTGDELVCRRNNSFRIKALAGSVMTKLTDLPVASNVPDMSTGGFGRVNVILPRPTRLHRADYDIAKLKAGANEREILTST